jgi:SAM-dependent methyltransferase
LDIDSEASRTRKTADVFYDGSKFPFEDATFDSVICSQVLEHVFEPDFFISEICRVLKPGGKVMLTVPFIWDEHEQPYDFARYSSFGLVHLLGKAGFRILHHEKIGGDYSTIFQLSNAYFFKATQKLPKAVVIGLVGIIFCFNNLCGVISKVLLPANADLFLDQIVIAQK